MSNLREARLHCLVVDMRQRILLRGPSLRCLCASCIVHLPRTIRLQFCFIGFCVYIFGRWAHGPRAKLRSPRRPRQNSFVPARGTGTMCQRGPRQSSGVLARVSRHITPKGLCPGPASHDSGVTAPAPGPTIQWSRPGTRASGQSSGSGPRPRSLYLACSIGPLRGLQCILL